MVVYINNPFDKIEFCEDMTSKKVLNKNSYRRH